MDDENVCKNPEKRNIATFEERLERLERLYEVMSEWHKPFNKRYECGRCKKILSDCRCFSYATSTTPNSELTTKNSEVTKKSDTIAIDRKLVEDYFKCYYDDNVHNRFNDVLKKALEAEDGK